MKRNRKDLQSGERIFVDIDLHNNKWHVTVRTTELELFTGSIPGIWEAIKNNSRTIQMSQG